MDDKIELHLYGLSKSNQNDAFALILSSMNNGARLPIVIGLSEAQAIALVLEKITPPRPLTHDLFVSLAQSIGVTDIEVLIYDLRDGIFYSKLICHGATECCIDARTSDAVAIGLRFGDRCRIFAYRHVLDSAGISTDHEHHAAPPAATPLSGKSIGELQIMLDNAVKAEKYEFASDIKKEILRRQTDRPF